MATQTEPTYTPDELLTAKERLRRRAWGATLEDVLSLLRTAQRTNDYFVGHSLAETITERIDIIGKATNPSDEVGGTRTLLADIAFIRAQGLAAIDAAIAEAEG